MSGLPQVKQEYFPLGGGLDLLTPAIALKTGGCIDAQNYEPEISGGYKRYAGFERYDGRSKPSNANYWEMTANITGAIAVGNTVTGGASGATGKVLLVVGNLLVLGRVTGTFVVAENLLVSAVSQGTATSTCNVTSEAAPSNDADYMLLAANDLRGDILQVPGSGPIRGVCVLNDILYAFRDNVGGTAGAMYKATLGGWVQVAFGSEIQFTAATAQINAGDTITGGTSGATATVVASLLRTGTWSSAGVGTLVITPISGVWQNGEAIKVSAVSKATSSSLATAITRQPGGQLDFSIYNFTSSGTTTKMYGADGVNIAFEFDGTNYIPIRTGMAVDTPTHVMGHRNFLFLSFQGSVQYSSIAYPYGWTTVTGAGELACGDPVTGFLPQAANSSGSSMAIFTRTRTFILYGSSNLNWTLVPSIFDLGYAAFTMQPVSNNTYGMTPRGLQCLVTTLTYGDFDFNSVAHSVMPYITARRGTETVSTSLRGKDQYRMYYSDGTCLCLGLTGDNVNGAMVLNYGKPVRCITTSTLSNGTEVTYFGSDDGYVYQDNIGTSLDGNAVEAWVRLAFNHSKSPQVRKKYRRAVLEVKALGYCKVNMSYDLGYATPAILAPAYLPDQVLTGGGGYWDQFTWDQFTWDAAVLEEPKVSLSGTEKNIGFLFYSNRAQDRQHTLQGVTLFYTPQRAER